MRLLPLIVSAIVCTFVLSMPALVSGQVTETVGSRALGMGGAFVAVASDSSAVWWNPAGLGAGPFFDMAVARDWEESSEDLPAWRQKTSGFSIGTPPIGFSYYRFRITDIQPFDPTDPGSAGREDRRVGVPVRSLSASHLGLTLVQTLATGVHAGATVKYVRGTVHAGREDGLLPPPDLLDAGEALETSDAEGRFDADIGVLAVAGVVRLGARMRNVFEPEIGGIRLARQTRVGVAIDPEPVTDLALTVALDADLSAYEGPTGERRMVAAGVEQWFVNRRVGIRGGGRVNTVGAQERIATAGASVAVRLGTFVEAYIARGSAGESGWGVAARVSF